MLQGDPNYGPGPSYKERFIGGNHTFYQDRLQHTTPRSGPIVAPQTAGRFDPAYAQFFDKRSRSVHLDEKDENSAIETPASIFKRHNEIRPLGSGSEFEDGSYNRDQLFQVTEESYKSFSPSRSRFQDDSYHSAGQYVSDFPSKNDGRPYPMHSQGFNPEEASVSEDHNESRHSLPRRLGTTSQKPG